MPKHRNYEQRKGRFNGKLDEVKNCMGAENSTLENTYLSALGQEVEG